MIAVAVASTFWFDAGSISAAGRRPNNSRPERASTTRMPTRSRFSVAPWTMSRSTS